MDDLISRQAVIEAIDSVLVEDESCKVWFKLAVKNLPSAQPEPLTVNIDNELTKDECDRLKQVMRDSPILLLPSAQSERKKGKWIREDGIAHGIVSRVVKCSLCGKNAGLSEEGFWNLSDFCPNCGARMEVKE
jgi:hypothetical protein